MVALRPSRSAVALAAFLSLSLAACGGGGGGDHTPGAPADSTPPTAPVLSSTTPASPSNSLAPHVVGTAEARSTVRIYSTPTCTGTPLASGAATASGTFDIPAAATQNATTAFYATATDASGNVSPCSAPLSYLHDGLAPAAPVLAATSPASPSPNPSPHVTGTAEAGSTVRIYASASCSGSPAAIGTATGSNFDLVVAAPTNATTSFSATATDVAGNVSPCSASLSYVHDGVAPAAPALAASTPASPSANPSPHVTGTAEAGSTVQIYASASCAGSPAATGTATGGAFDLVVAAPTNAATSYAATATDAAGNVSACSTVLSYRHDDQPPPAPALSATSPASPSNVASPHVTGGAEAGATVQVFASAACSGAPVASGVAVGGAFDLVVSAAANATTIFTATATDAAGNVSACSSTLSYLHDGVAPGAPALAATSPVSPSPNASPHLTGSAEAGSTVRVYASASCAGSPVQTGTATGLGAFDLVVSAPANVTTTFTATATDAAGNVSACSGTLSYQHDSLPPAAPTISASTPTSPSSNASPHLTGSAEAGSTVRIYASASCAGSPAVTGTATGGAFDLVVAPVPNATTIFTATATDAAGNVSTCSLPLSYRHDDQPPAAPALSSSSPASPSNVASPHLLGGAEPGATVKVYATADCSGPPLVSGTATGGAFDLVAAATQNGTTAFRATATDAAGNTSACSAPLSYLHDGVAPGAPALSGTTPASPSNDPAPHLSGSAETGATVRVYGNAACTGSPLATGSAAGGLFSIQIAAPLNGVTTLAATATDAAGNTSACSGTTTYLHDGIAPGAPALVATTPGSPSSDPAPHLTGNAEALATVRVYATVGCTGAPLATGAANGSGAFDIVVPAALETTRSFRATATDAAGNGSACSAPLAYAHDDVAPLAPLLTGTAPASPSRTSFTPAVRGTAEPGAAVELHAGAACGGLPLASGFADGTGAFSLQVTVSANSTTPIGALARDAAGNTSPCSTTLTYVHDDIAPAAPVLSGSSPASPANHNAPAIRGTAEPGSTVVLFTDPGCSTPVSSGTAAGDGSFSLGVAVADNTTTSFYGKSTDAAGNPSGCSLTSVTYVEESRTFSVSPASIEVDPAPSPLSGVTLSYTLTGGPDAGVTWSVDEAGGGTVDAAGHYLAPAQTGTYHVSATTKGALPALVARATVVVRSPIVQGTIAYSGPPGAGRIYVSIAASYGGAALGGTSIAVNGPGSYPYTVRGLVAAGTQRLTAWFDAAGIARLVPSLDPSGQVDVVLAGASLSGVNVTLVAPAAVAPAAPQLKAVFPGNGAAVVVYDPARDSNGDELADGHDVSCTTGAPPPLPGPGAIHVPAGADGVAFVHGLPNGLTYTCSAWATNHGARSAPVVSSPFVVGPPTGGFTVSGTIGFSGPAPTGAAWVVLLDQSLGVARTARYASATFPLSYSVAGVPPGDYALGLIVDAGDDGAISVTDFNSLDGGPSKGLPVSVAGDLAGQDLTFTRANGQARTIVSHSTSGSDRYDLALVLEGGAKVPATAVATAGPDVRPPVDLGVARIGGNAPSLTATRSLGATPPAFGTYLFDVTYADGTTEQLAATVSAASLLAPPTPVAPTGGGNAAAQPVFTWAEPIPTPPAPASYRLSVGQQSGPGVWNSDDVPASACSGGTGTCTIGWNFDGRAWFSPLPPGDYRWDVTVTDAGGNQASAGSTFHVPVDVTIAPATAALYPGDSALLTATVTGTGSVTWGASCGTVTPRANPLQADYLAPLSGSCTVTATSTAEPSRSGSATIAVKPIGVAVAPASVSLDPGQVQVFTAAVAGPGSVTWSATCGTLSPIGDPLARSYTAPASGPCTVTATSDVQPGSAGNAVVSVGGAPQLQASPPLATLNPGQSQPFVATLAGALVPATWSVVETGGGTFSPEGVYSAPFAPGLYHVTATDGTGHVATAVVRVVDAGVSPQPTVTVSPASTTLIAGGGAAFSATVNGCVDQTVSWSVLEPGASLFPTPPSSTNFQAWTPGLYHLVARAACDSTKAAVAAVTVRLPSVSGSVSYTGSAGGRIYVALVTNYGEVVSGTSLSGPGPFTLHGIQYSGDYSVRAWRDTLGAVTFQPNLEPFAEVSITIPPGADYTGAVLALADVTPAAPPPPGSVSVAPGDGAAVIFVQRVEDGNRNSLADGYHLSCDTAPTPSGTPVRLDATLTDDQAFVFKAPNGTSWSCEGWATAGALSSTHVSSGSFSIGAGPGGQTVSGVISGQGPAPAGPLYVIVFSQTGGIFTQRIASPVFPQAFSVAGVPDGDYQVGAFLDRNDDGVMARTDPLTFRSSGGLPITVAGGPISGLALSLPFDPATAFAATQHWVSSFGPDYQLNFQVQSNLRVPREAVLTGGPGVWPSVDLGVDSNQGGGEVRLRTRFHLGSTRPQVGDTYDLLVTYTDGTTETLHPQISAVLDPPTLLAPVDPLGTPITAGAKPLFQWAAPATLPATPYTYSVYVYQGASWNLWDLPPSQLQATYGDPSPGGGSPPASPATLPAGVYRWVAAVQDASGNYASQDAQFTVTP